MQSSIKQEALVYCPNCSVQNPLDEALLGTSVICIKCGHPFVAKKPNTKSYLFNNIWMRGLSILVMLFVACLVEEMASGVIDNFTPRGKAKKDSVLIMKYIDEYGARFRQYGQTACSTIDIYCTQTGDELLGKKNPKKYRRAIEQSLEEAKSLHVWCKQKLKTFNPQMLTKEGELLKNMVREAYTSYYELTTIGIELFSKTLECHQIHCGMKTDASSKDREAYRAFLKKNTTLAEMAEALANMDKEVMQIAEKYSSIEGEKIAAMKSNLELLNKTNSR